VKKTWSRERDWEGWRKTAAGASLNRVGGRESRASSEQALHK
jgi:hypothetical protein